MKIRPILVSIALLMASGSAFADGIEVGKIYRLAVTVSELSPVGEPGSTHVAVKNNKFRVMQKLKDGFVVQFEKIYKLESEKTTECPSCVKWDKLYKLKSDLGNSVELESVSSESLTGLSAGPLVVPFKYRLDDKSLTGDAKVGLYAGITFEPGCTRSNWCFRFTPLLSAGLSQVSVTDGTSEENQTAVTVAAGFLITNWSSLNIGFVYGQDRIGDSNWDHEGEGWMSFMVGWQLTD